MLRAHALSFERFDLPVFEPVSFGVAAGDCLLLSGPNGVGKSTLLRLLAGSLEPSAGEVHWPRDWSRLYIGHQPGLDPSLSVLENLRFYARLQRADASQQNLEAVLERLDIAHLAHQQSAALSAGQRKRTALGRALLSRSRCWLMDEPYANLDAAGSALVDELLLEQQRDGMAVILASHGSMRPPESVRCQELLLRPGLDPAAEDWA